MSHATKWLRPWRPGVKSFSSEASNPEGLAGFFKSITSKSIRGLYSRAKLRLSDHIRSQSSRFYKLFLPVFGEKLVRLSSKKRQTSIYRRPESANFNQTKLFHGSSLDLPILTCKVIAQMNPYLNTFIPW